MGARPESQRAGKAGFTMKRIRFFIPMAAVALVMAALAGPGVPPAAAQAAETATHRMLATSFTAGVSGASPRAVLRTTLAEPAGARTESPSALGWGGFLVPPVDAWGLITLNRLTVYLLGSLSNLDLTLADFAGNTDGRFDVADIVAFINHHHIK